MMNFVATIAALILAFAWAGYWNVALVCIAVVPLLVLSSGIMLATNERMSKYEAHAYGQASKISSEAIAAVRTVQALNAQGGVLERFRYALVPAERASVQKVVANGCSIGGMNASFMIMYLVAGLYIASLIADKFEETDCNLDGFEQLIHEGLNGPDQDFEGCGVHGRGIPACMARASSPAWHAHPRVHRACRDFGGCGERRSRTRARARRHGCHGASRPPPVRGAHRPRRRTAPRVRRRRALCRRPARDALQHRLRGHGPRPDRRADAEGHRREAGGQQGPGRHQPRAHDRLGLRGRRQARGDRRRRRAQGRALCLPLAPRVEGGQRAEPHDRRGRARRARRPLGLGQVDRDGPRAALLRPPERLGHARRPRPHEPQRAVPALEDRPRRAGAGALRGHLPREHRVRRAGARGERGGRGRRRQGGQRPRLHQRAAARLPDRRGRGRLQDLGRAEAARRHRARDHPQAGGAAPRRGDLRARQRVGEDRAGRARRAHGQGEARGRRRRDHDRHRAPAVDHLERRLDLRDQGRRAARARHPRGAPRPEGRLRGAPPAPSLPFPRRLGPSLAFSALPSPSPPFPHLLRPSLTLSALPSPSPPFPRRLRPSRRSSGRSRASASRPAPPGARWPPRRRPPPRAAPRRRCPPPRGRRTSRRRRW